MLELVGQLLNFTLSFFLWMMLGRLVLGLLTGGRTNFVTETFRRATLPVFVAVRWITPASVSDRHIPVLSLPLLVALRILLLPILREGP